MNLNKVFIVGRVTKDPEVRALPSGAQVANFGMATNRFWTKDGVKQDEVEFHNIVVFGKLADIAQRFVTKGALILIEGRLKTSSWDDKNGGGKRYKTEIIGEVIQLGPRPNGATAPAPQKEYAGEASPEELAAMDAEKGQEEIDVNSLEL